MSRPLLFTVTHYKDVCRALYCLLLQTTNVYVTPFTVYCYTLQRCMSRPLLFTFTLQRCMSRLYCLLLHTTKVYVMSRPLLFTVTLQRCMSRPLLFTVTHYKGVGYVLYTVYCYTTKVYVTPFTVYCYTQQRWSRPLLFTVTHKGVCPLLFTVTHYKGVLSRPLLFFYCVCQALYCLLLHTTKVYVTPLHYCLLFTVTLQRCMCVYCL